MGSLVLGGFDVVGDGDDDVMLGDDDDEMTAGRGRRVRRRGGKIAVPTPRWMNATTSQGVSRPQEELDFLPFIPATIIAGALTGVCTSSPQRPFRPERIVMDAVSNALSAVFNCVIDPAIFVGAVQIGASQGSVPIAVFAGNAFGVRLSMPATGQGTDIRIPIRLLAAAANATVVTATILGRAMR